MCSQWLPSACYRRDGGLVDLSNRVRLGRFGALIRSFGNLMEPAVTEARLSRLLSTTKDKKE